MSLLKKFRKKSKILPQYVSEARTAFNNCSVFKEYLTDELLPYLNNLLIRDVEWLRLIVNQTEEVKENLQKSFEALASNLVKWKKLMGGNQENIEDKSEIPMLKKNCISDLIENTYDCYVLMISVFVLKSSNQNLEVLKNFSTEAFESISKSFSKMILTSKLECIKSDLLLGFSEDIPWSRINSYIKEHFFLFTLPELPNSPGFLHALLQEELKANKVICDTLTISQFEDFFRSFFSSFESFELLLEKNIFYYSLCIELEKQYIFISQLHKHYSKAQSAGFSLQITHSRSAKYRNRVYEFDKKGLVRVSKDDQEIKIAKRSEPDCLVFIGSDKSNKFLSDIAVNLEDQQDPAALIFFNRCGPNLVDISPRCSVKFRAKREILGKKNFFVLGRLFYLHIHICDNLTITDYTNEKKKILIFYVFNYGEYTKSSEVAQDLATEGKITISRDKENKISFNNSSAENLLAVVRMDEYDKIFIEDRSEGNLFVSLKSKAKLNKGKWSKFRPLSENCEFFIDNVGFRVFNSTIC